MELPDCVEVIVEKETYAREGVHLGMQGWICLEQRTEGDWLVNFPQYGEKDDIAETSIKEKNLKLIPIMDPKINEQINGVISFIRNHFVCFIVSLFAAFEVKNT